MIIGVAKETYPGERRVALIPASAGPLVKAGMEVCIEAGAGLESGFTDDEYKERGCNVVASRSEVFSQADVLLQVRTFGSNPDQGATELEMVKPGQVVIGFVDPLNAPERSKQLAEKNISLFSMEMMPRITRAQSMDALSSMATVAGYKAVLMAAVSLPRMFPMSMTAAGTIAPARVFVIGAGVAGLQAIATAKRLGAVVKAYDVRPAVKEQIESLGGKFVEMELETSASEDKGGYAKAQDEEFYRKQRELMASVVKDSDVVITTAAIPGKKSPVLVTGEMVATMPPGSVIIDLAAERGGNCELTKADETVVEHNVTIMGPTNLPTDTPYHASQMYAKNITTFLMHLVPAATPKKVKNEETGKWEEVKVDPKDYKVEYDMDDEITTGTLIARDGQVVHQRVRELLGMPAPSGTATAASDTAEGGAADNAENKE